jgi:hypothetical protein
MKCSKHEKDGSHGHRDSKIEARKKVTGEEEMEGDEIVCSSYKENKKAPCWLSFLSFLSFVVKFLSLARGF